MRDFFSDMHVVASFSAEDAALAPLFLANGFPSDPVVR